MGSSGSGSGSSSGNQTVTTRYARYIESRHANFLAATQVYRKTAIINNPYKNVKAIQYLSGFFAAGQTLSTLTPLFSVIEDDVLGVDTNILWNNTVESVTHGQYAHNLVKAHSDVLNEELDSTELPRFMTGMRDINSVMSSSFINGKAILMASKQRQVAKFDAELRYKMVDIANDKFKTDLNWRINKVNNYSEVIKTFISARDSIITRNYELSAKRILWNLDVLDYERANLGALQGATKANTNTSTSGASTGLTVLGGAMSGAAMGATVTGGNPIGAVVGGVIGGLAGLL